MIIGHQVSSLDVCWNLVDAEKASMKSLAPGKVSSVWAPDISCLSPAH